MIGKKKTVYFEICMYALEICIFVDASLIHVRVHKSEEKIIRKLNFECLIFIEIERKGGS